MMSIPKHHLSTGGSHNSSCQQDRSPPWMGPIGRIPGGWHVWGLAFDLPMDTAFFSAIPRSSLPFFPILPRLEASSLPIAHMHLLHSIFYNGTATTEIYTLSLHDALHLARTPVDVAD